MVFSENTGVIDAKSGTPSFEYLQWREVVANRPAELKKVPPHIIDYNLCLLAVRRSGFAIAHVPPTLLDDRLMVIAVKRDGMALDFIPHKHRTERLCFYACETDGRALKFIPREFLPAIAPDVLRRSGQFLRAIKKDATKEMIDIALEEDPLALQHVNLANQTSEMVFNAVRRNGEALQFVNHELFTDELIELALVNDRFGWVGHCLPKIWFDKYHSKIKKLDLSGAI